jgi:hypothetical protein
MLFTALRGRKVLVPMLPHPYKYRRRIQLRPGFFSSFVAIPVNNH